LAKILVVDDEEPIRGLLRLYLTREGFGVCEAADGDSALCLARTEQVDAVVLDLLLPGIDGWRVCTELRATSRVPILMLTARDEEEDVVAGLELGADDYLTKPFSPRELVARIRALLRRSRPPEAATQQVLFGECVLDLEARQLSVRGEPVACPAREFDLLALLATHPRRCFSREQLLQALWGGDAFVEPRTVDVHVHRLREKIEADASRPRHLLTVWGVGYRFEPGGAQGPRVSTP
jgi:two-component system response regulator ResD